MKDVRFYDFDFNRLGEFPHFISLNYEKNYCGFGNVEIHFPITETDIIELLANNEFLFFEAEMKFAVVTGWKIADDIAVYARTPEWLLTKRCVLPFEYKNTSAGEIIMHVLDAASDMVVVEELRKIDTYVDYSTDHIESIYDVLCDFLGGLNLGFELFVDFDVKCVKFRVFSGVERQLVLSQKNRNAFDLVYIGDVQDMASGSGWYERRYEDKGDWNASKNSPALKQGKSENFYTFYRISGAYNDRFGLNCVEGEYLFCDNTPGIWKTTAEKPTTGFVFLDNVEVSGLRRWETILDGVKTGEQGEKELQSKRGRQDITAEVKSAEYGSDYSLGDIICVQTEFGSVKKSEKKRVTSVSFYWDVDKSGIAPVLSSLEE